MADLFQERLELVGEVNVHRAVCVPLDRPGVKPGCKLENRVWLDSLRRFHQGLPCAPIDSLRYEQLDPATGFSFRGEKASRNDARVVEHEQVVFA